MTRRNRIGIALVAVALAGAVYWAWRARREANAGPASEPTRATVERRTLERLAEAAGIVEPVQVVEVKSRASGEVRRVPVDSGARVEAGTLLVEIDPRDVDNALAQAEADVAAARVAARIARSQADRMTQLLGDGIVAQADLDGATNSAAAADAAVLRAETNLSLARERRGDVTIRAPLAGTILERQVEPGQIIASATANVSGGTTLFRMADLAEMRVRAKIDETDIGSVRPGQSVRLTFEAFGARAFAGEIEKIEPQSVVEQNVTLFPVLVRLDNRDGALLPGMSAELSIEIERREQVLAIPSAAIAGRREAENAAAALGVEPEKLAALLRGGPGEGKSALVFVATAAGPEPRRIAIGMSDWEHTEVVDGLAEGDEVYLVTTLQLGEQQRALEQRFRQRAAPGMGGGGGRP